MTSMWIGDDLEAVLSPERAILARREELREQRAADKLAAEREERAETRQWQLEHSGKQPHTHQEILAAWARPDPRERVFVAGHLPECDCGGCGWQDVPERAEVEESGGTVDPKWLNKFELQRQQREREAQETDTARQLDEVKSEQQKTRE